MPPDAPSIPATQGSATGPIRILSDPDPAIWESYVRVHPEASLFHGLLWQRSLQKIFHAYHPCHRIAMRGDSVCGVLPLYRVPSLPFGCALISTPLGVYGGVCADDEAAAQALLEDAAAYARTIGARYVELRQERPLTSLPTKELYVFFRRPIHANREANLMEIPGKQRRGIRTAEGHRLTHRIGGLELLPQFFDVYSTNMRNLGSPGVPESFFRALLEEYGNQSLILAVFHGERMVAGVLTFYYRDRIMPYYASSTPEGMTVSANTFMYWNLMCHAAEHGFRVFDFGRSKKDSGSYHFKRHWGFTPMPLPYQYQLVKQREMPNLSPTNPKYALAIQAWRRMPLGFTKWLGPKLVPFFP